jgi:general secretion pathway protein I
VSSTTGNNKSGFTLLEVLIALTILAVISAGFLGSMNVTLRQQQILEEKTIALWVAKNQLAKLHAGHNWPDVGTSKEAALMAGRTWNVAISVTSTNEPKIRKITVDVSDSSKQKGQSPAASLAGYVGMQ